MINQSLHTLDLMYYLGGDVPKISRHGGPAQ